MPLNAAAAAEKKPQPAGATPWPALIPLAHHQGKPPIPIMRPVVLVGSRHNAHLHLLSRQISKAHALLINSDGKVYIRDLASRTHVYVNGTEAREAELSDGDLIKLGSFTFRFQAASGMKQKPRADDTPAGQLEVEGADFPLMIDQRVMLIGRRPSCDISLVEDTCSTAHAVVFSMGGKRFVRDLGSRTGTYVNGQPVRQQEISFGDTIRIGETLMRYESSNGVVEGAPADVAATPAAADMDELEDLVGTAPLVGAEVAEAAEAPLDLEQGEPLPIGRAGPSLAAAKDAGHDPLHASAADLDFDLDSMPLATDSGAKKSAGDTAVLPIAEARAAAGRSGQRDDADLIPVVTDEPEAAVAPLPPRPPAPPPAPEPEPQEPQERLVGDDLAAEKLSSSGTGAGMQAAAREAMEMDEPPADEAPMAEPVADAPSATEAELLSELPPPPPPAQVEQVEQKATKRRGWFSWGRRRAEHERTQAPSATAGVDSQVPSADVPAEPAPQPLPTTDPEPQPAAAEEPFFEPQIMDEVLDLSAEQPAVQESAPPAPPPPPPLAMNFQTVVQEEPAPHQEPEVPSLPADEAVEPLELEPAPEDAPATIAEETEAPEPEPVAQVHEDDTPSPAEAEPLVVTAQASEPQLPSEPEPEPQPQLTRFDDIFFGDESIEEIADAADAHRDHDALELAVVAEHAEPPAEAQPDVAPFAADSGEPAAAAAAVTDTIASVQAPSAAEEIAQVEVVEPTEPTSESAFALDAVSSPQPPQEPRAPSAASEVDVAQEVQAFSGEALPEPIVESSVTSEEHAASSSTIADAPAAGADEPFAVAGEAHFSAATIEPDVSATVSEPVPASPAGSEEPPAIEPAQPQAAAGEAAAGEAATPEPPAEQAAAAATPISFEIVSGESAPATPKPLPSITTIDELEIATAPEALPAAPIAAEATADIATAASEEPLADIEEMDLPAPVQDVATAAVEPIESFPQPQPSAAPVAPELEASLAESFPAAGPAPSATADAIPDLTDDVAAAEAAEAEALASPILVPGMPLFDAGAQAAPDFVGGMPLILDELPAPPPTFGRVQVSFGDDGGAPRALVDDDDDEPGPFDSLKIDIDNPVPGAPTGSYFGEVPAFDDEDWFSGEQDEAETETDGGEQQPEAEAEAEAETEVEEPTESEEAQSEQEAQPWGDVEAEAPADLEPWPESEAEPQANAEPDAIAEPQIDGFAQAAEAEPEAAAADPAFEPQPEPVLEADAPAQEPFAEPAEALSTDEPPISEPQSPQPIAEEADEPVATEAQVQTPEEPAAPKPKSLFAGRHQQDPAPEEQSLPDPDGFEVPPPGFSQSAAQSFGGLASGTAPGRDVDVFSQGFSADLSNDPFFGAAVKPLPPHELPLPPRGPATGRKNRSLSTKRPVQVDPRIDDIASKLADDLGAPDGPSIVEDDPAIPDEPPASLARRNRGGVPGAVPRRADQARNDLALSDRGAATAAAFTAPQSPFSPRPRRGYRIGILLFIMFFLMATAFAAIYTFMKQKVSLQGWISFQNFGQLPVAEQRRLQDGQKQIMVSDHLRDVALNDYRAFHPMQPAGFLGQPLEFARNETRVKWDGATMIYRLDNADPQDAERLKSVLSALYKLDAEMVATADKNRIELENLRRTVDQKQKELDSLKARRERAHAAVEHQLSPDQIQALAAEKEAAEQKWKQAVAVRSAAEAELKRIEEAAAASSAAGNSTTKPAAAAAAANSLAPTAARTGDAELAKMQTDLEQMNARLTAARSAVADQAELARKALDDAQEKFLGDVEKLQGVLKDNPELSAFVSAAQRLQETAQKLSGDLLERTQKTYERQMQEKRELDDRIANRRKELWEADKEIKRLKDDLGMRERGYNAAVANGYDKEADQIKTQMDQSLEKIRLRQMELENDPILVTLNEFSAKRQQEIALTQKQLEADRKQAESLSRELEKNFAQLQPSVEKLPENQKAFAQRMAAKVETINNARKSYAEALERKNAQADPTLKFIEEQVHLLSARIEDRKKSLAAMNSQQLTAEERQQRQAFLDQKRSSFDELKKAEREAYNLYFEKMKASEMAANDVTSSNKAREEFDRLTQQLYTLRDQELPQITAQLQQKEQLGIAVAYPAEPKFEEPKALPDQRPLYTLGAVAGIALVFSLLIAFTGGSAATARTYQATVPSPYLLPPPAPAALQGTTLDPLSGARVPKAGLLAIPAAAHSPEESAIA
jgi:pSer/pThr/pTyr-binding forkhead associated (FHA) protein